MGVRFLQALPPKCEFSLQSKGWTSLSPELLAEDSCLAVAILLSYPMKCFAGKNNQVAPCQLQIIKILDFLLSSTQSDLLLSLSTHDQDVGQVFQLLWTPHVPCEAPTEDSGYNKAEDGDSNGVRCKAYKTNEKGPWFKHWM